jgi:hypothetical protein
MSNAASLDRPPGSRGPRVDRGLEVDVLKRRQVTRHHRVMRAVAPQELAHQNGYLIALARTRRRGMDPVEKIPEGRGELPSLPVRWLTRHGIDLRLLTPRPRGPGHAAELNDATALCGNSFRGRQRPRNASFQGRRRRRVLCSLD